MPGLEADLKEDLARGDDAAVAANRAQLEQLRAWQKDSAPLEKLRQELLAQLENAEDPIQRVRGSRAAGGGGRGYDSGKAAAAVKVKVNGGGASKRPPRRPRPRRPRRRGRAGRWAAAPRAAAAARPPS